TGLKLIHYICPYKIQLYFNPFKYPPPLQEYSAQLGSSAILQAWAYSGLNLNQDKATKPQTVQRVRQGEATPYWFKVNPL
ncbi:hypothetical protein HMPREF3136_01510, partial [Neisseria sp. HMSC15C08]